MNPSNANKASTTQPHINIIHPSSILGWQVNQLIKRCPPLDENSTYCNILQCDHFSQTSAAALLDNKLVGFISGYIKPEQADTLFIWQVAVDQQARGQSLASRMLQFILQGSACTQVQFLETTITENNQASWALFTSLARKLASTHSKQLLYDHQQHFQQQSDSEFLMRIGPFQKSNLS